MIIRIDWPLTNDHQDRPAPCKRSSWWNNLLQMIIWNDWPLANDHPFSLLQMIIRIEQPLANDHTDRPSSCKGLFGSTGLYVPYQKLICFFFTYSWMRALFAFKLSLPVEKVDMNIALIDKQVNNSNWIKGRHHLGIILGSTVLTEAGFSTGLSYFVCECNSCSFPFLSLLECLKTLITIHSFSWKMVSNLSLTF